MNPVVYGKRVAAKPHTFKRAVVFYYKAWCPYCHKFSDAGFKELVEYAQDSKVHIVAVDAEKHAHALTKRGIEFGGVPHVVYYDDWGYPHELTGARDLKSLIQFVSDGIMDGAVARGERRDAKQARREARRLARHTL
jgi:glutaredoxin